MCTNTYHQHGRHKCHHFGTDWTDRQKRLLEGEEAHTPDMIAGTFHEVLFLQQVAE